MAKGFATAREAFAEIEARKNAGGNFGPYFKLPKSGDSAVVRFIDDEVDWVWVHELPPEPGKYSQTAICRDQDLDTGQRNGEPCKGCDEDYRRKMQGVVRLIWRDAPVYEKDSNGKFDFSKVVGKEDQAVRWSVGKVVLEELDGKAHTFKGLTSRPFTVTRRGTGLDTSYDIEPVVDDEGNTSASPMTEAEKKLAAEADPIEYKIPSYEDWGKKSRKSSGDSAPPVADVSPFMKKRQEATA